jgi:hypothetical protein
MKLSDWKEETGKRNGWAPNIVEYRFHHVRGKGDEFDDTAWLIAVPQPFGLHLVVSAFNGENQYSLICTGGHKANILVVEHQVDSTIKVKNFAPDSETLEEAREYWLRLMPEGLMTATKIKIEELIAAEKD